MILEHRYLCDDSQVIFLRSIFKVCQLVFDIIGKVRMCAKRIFGLLESFRGNNSDVVKEFIWSIGVVVAKSLVGVIGPMELNVLD